MRFWDSSAIVPLLVAGPMSPAMRDLYRADSLMLAWWGADIECTSAICRRQRAGGLGVDVVTDALLRLSALRASWHEVEPGEEVRESANRFLRVHDLRAADALQLAAAFFAAEARPATLEFVTLDDRLLEAARREGFPTARVVPRPAVAPALPRLRP
jgi:predicted nucleic acid-binding protein